MVTTAVITAQIGDLTTQRGWSLIVAIGAGVLWTFAGGIGSFEHSWMPRRSWIRTAVQATVTVFGVLGAARIGWDEFPSAPEVVTVVAIGLGWSTFGTAVGTILASAPANGAIRPFTTLATRLFPTDKRLNGVIDTRLRKCSPEDLMAGALRANDIAHEDETANKANKRRLDAAAGRNNEDLVVQLRKLIVSERITRGALSGEDGLLKRWPR